MISTIIYRLGIFLTVVWFAIGVALMFFDGERWNALGMGFIALIGVLIFFFFNGLAWVADPKDEANRIDREED